VPPAASVSSVHASDGIGMGPSSDACRLVARDVSHQHSGNHVGKAWTLGETGRAITARGDAPDSHEILTGALPGLMCSRQRRQRASTASSPATCLRKSSIEGTPVPMSMQRMPSMSCTISA
jgi:hypothetical protein